MQFSDTYVVTPSGHVAFFNSPSVHVTSSSCFSGQGANSQSGGTLPTAVPSGHTFASSVHATGS